MSSEQENTMNNNDRSNSSTKYGGQQNQNRDKKQHDSKEDQTKRGSGMNQPRVGKQDQRNNDGKKDIDTERRREEQVREPNQYEKDDQTYNDDYERS